LIHQSTASASSTGCKTHTKIPSTPPSPFYKFHHINNAKFPDRYSQFLNACLQSGRTRGAGCQLAVTIRAEEQHNFKRYRGIFCRLADRLIRLFQCCSWCESKRSCAVMLTVYTYTYGNATNRKYRHSDYMHTYNYLQTYNNIYTYIHTYMHTYIHTYASKYVNPYMHICIYPYIHTYICKCIHTYTTHTCIQIYIYTHIYIYIHTYIHTYMCTHVYICTQTYIRIYTHTYIHTYLQTHIHTYIHT